MLSIRRMSDDIPAREALLDACFGDERFEKTCERLREGRRPARGLSLVSTPAAASSARCGCGMSRPGRAARRCCSGRSRSIPLATASASARS